MLRLLFEGALHGLEDLEVFVTAVRRTNAKILVPNPDHPEHRTYFFALVPRKSNFAFKAT